MKKRIFKAGNYGKKGNWTKEYLKSLVSEGKEFSVVPGHIGDWVNNGYVRTAIPKGGTVKCVDVDKEGYLVGEINYNEFGSKVTEGGVYDNFSIGFKKDGSPDHLALLGYAPPHIKDLDKAFSEFSIGVEEEVSYIEFEEGEKNMTIKEIAELIKGLDITEENSAEFALLNEEVWKKQDQAFYVDKLRAEGYEVSKEFSEGEIKEFAKGIGFELKEILVPKSKTEEEIRKEIRAEFAAEAEAEKREGEKIALKEKFVGLFPPGMKELAEFTVEAAFTEENYENIIEFSEDEKLSMKEKISQMTKEDGPFSKLFKNITEGFEFSVDEGEVTSTEDRVAAYNIK